MRRKNLSVRAVTSVGQNLPQDWEEKMASFKIYLEEKKINVELPHIGNMDEVPMNFDMPTNRTVDAIGTDDIKIETTGAEKCNFTIILCATADGGKCIPMVIFKRKTMPKEKFPTGIIVKVNEKGWMNEHVFSEWLTEVWGTRKGKGPFDVKSVLIYDSAKCHLTERSKKAVLKHAEPVVIPGGLTKKLQPLDLSVNKSFKFHIRHHWENWMISGIHTYTKSGKMRRVAYAEICRWVVESWNSITAECIKNGFRKGNICSYENEGSDVEEMEEDESSAETESSTTEVDRVDYKIDPIPDKSDYEDFYGF